MTVGLIISAINNGISTITFVFEIRVLMPFQINLNSLSPQKLIKLNVTFITVCQPPVMDMDLSLVKKTASLKQSIKANWQSINSGIG